MTTPYYQADGIVLFLGDCRDVTEWLAADVLVTDPPYGIAWDRPATGGAKNPWVNPGIAGDVDTSTRDAALAMWGCKPGVVFGSLRATYPAGWRRMLVFQKAPLSGLFGWLPWRSDWEPLFVIGDWPKTVARRSSVYRTAAMSAGGYRGYATATGHPHTKPADVMQEIIADCLPGTVADPFAGSGSTLVAAKMLGRQAIGVELDERYCEIAARRLSQGVLDFEGAS